jgi:predicted nucleic acid-binding protein
VLLSTRAALGPPGADSAIFRFLSRGRICLERSWRCGTTSGTEVAFYVDTSALVKLVVAEAETTALRSWLTDGDRDLVSCDLVRTELMRAVRRIVPDRALQARAVLDSVTLVEVASSVFEEAGRLDPSVLRSLDAIHLASALDLGDDLEGLVTYDDRLAEAAEANGVAAFSPR